MELRDAIDCDNVDCYELATLVCAKCGEVHCPAHASHADGHTGPDVEDAPSDPEDPPADPNEPLNPA